MTKPIARDPNYRKLVFDADIIELYVRWRRPPPRSVADRSGVGRLLPQVPSD